MGLGRCAAGYGSNTKICRDENLFLVLRLNIGIQVIGQRPIANKCGSGEYGSNTNIFYLNISFLSLMIYIYQRNVVNLMFYRCLSM